MHTTTTPEQVLLKCFDTNFDLVKLITEHQFQQAGLDINSKDTSYNRKSDILLPLVKDILKYKYEDFDEYGDFNIDIMNYRLYKSADIFSDYIDDLLIQGVKGKTLAEIIQQAQTIAYNEFLDLVLESI